MILDLQAAIIDWLGSPAAHGGRPVERIDTHSAVVFLAGDRALKLKRAVRFDYLDFSTVELRHAACAAELRLNRRTAPSIYRGVVAVTREADGSFALGGSGDPVDWCVDMARFDQAQLLDRLADRGALDVETIETLGEAVARFHHDAGPRRDHGGSAGMRWVIEGNAAGLAEYGRDRLDQSQCQRLTRDLLGELDRRAELLDRRRAAGFVRQCHGDLHLRNVVRLAGVPTPFDGVEFNDEIACIDVAYDLAFLLMDLWRRDLRAHANALLNVYLARTLDLEALAVLPLFLSCRAAVRAKTSATAARLQPDAGERLALERRAAEYLSLAEALLRRAPAALVAIGGRSGSGKTTVARALAPSMPPAPGALVLRSDVVRKQLAGAPLLDRLPLEAYSREMSARVYRALAQRARLALASEWPVIVDAAFLSAADRAAITTVADEASVPFAGLWLEAPASVLEARVAARGLDASDADAAVVRRQMAAETGPIAWAAIDASGGRDAVVERALARLPATPLVSRGIST